MADPSVFAGPLLVIVPGLAALLWAIPALRRATAPYRWPRVVGRVVAREPGAREPVDVVEYPLPDGGTRTMRPELHGTYESGRPIGTAVTVWRDPVDALNATLEVPGPDKFAGPLLVTVLGAFFFGGGLVWAGLILALVSR